MIFGSDITGKAIISIVKNNGGYISNLYGNEVKINGENELNEFIKLQKNKGFYPYVTDKEEYEELKNNKEKLNYKFSGRIILGFNICKDDITRIFDMRFPRPLHKNVDTIILGVNIFFEFRDNLHYISSLNLKDLS